PAIIAKLSGGPVCAVCGATADLWNLDTPGGSVLVHQECARFLPKPEPDEPSLAYRGVTAEPSGAGCEVTIVEIPATGLRYRGPSAPRHWGPPARARVERWRQCAEDGSKFLAVWGTQAESLGWTSADLFGLHTPPEQPHPSYRRLSRYDCTGLIWLLQGRP